MRILECRARVIFKWAYSNGRRPSFHWVYDCGTNSSPKLIQNAIQKYNQQENDANIDLLVLSHFDKDHISGVKELVKKQKNK